MSRRNQAIKKVYIADPIYHSAAVTQLVSKILKKGKKSTAEKIVYGAFDLIKEKLSKDPLEVFMMAIENVSPVMEVKSRRVGGANYQIPVEVSKERAHSLAMRWIVTFSQEKKGKPMMQKLTDEIVDGFNKTGSSFKKREDTHKMAEANKAFAHFRY
jgi:small subunit ribosomal protein S7